MIYLFTDVMKNLKVFPERMSYNIEISHGVIFSQRLLLALLRKGVMRDKARAMISTNAKIASEQEIDFQYLVLEDPNINSILTRSEIMDIFDFDCFRKNIDFIFEHAGL